jgi:hypothetical protein
MIRNTTCSECGGTMQEGYILDFTHGGRVQSVWMDGNPEESFWTGLKVDLKKTRPVSGYRCDKCGFLKLYTEPGTKIN